MDLNIDLFVSLYRHMAAARRLDETEADLGQRGEAPFHLSGSGHEGAAALWPHLVPEDWLYAHYRDKALLLARGIPLEHYVHALLATAGSPGQGRDMPPFVFNRELNVPSLPTLVGNNALPAVGIAQRIVDDPARPFVLCGIGDGGTQEGEFLEAVAEAVRSRLPVLFLVEDNRYALSTVTAGRTFYSRPDGDAAEFYGVPIVRLDGSDAVAAHAVFGDLVASLRRDRGPRIAVMRVERLDSHSNSDDQTVYRDADEIRRALESADPVRNLEKRLVAAGVAPERLRAIRDEIDRRLSAALDAARRAPAPRPGPAKRPLADALTHAAAEFRGAREGGSLTMLEAMRETLRHQLKASPDIEVYGQDVEDPKGDVFGLTRGLTRDFPGRVRNAPLSESTIVGAALGRALAGGRPVACLQFADFFPLAYNQLFSEVGSLYWRTAGEWEAPMIVMAITGGYRAGLGPFHAQSPEAVLAHVPGLDVFMPSTAADAAGLLNAAFASGRPSVFLYPKNLLNDRSRTTSPDIERHFVPIGRARLVRAGRDLTLVGWGNLVPLLERVADTLAVADVEAEVIDLRSLSPWDRETVLHSAERTGRLLVAHEDMQTAGLGGEILATVAEQARKFVRVARVTTPDTYVPFNVETQMELLPSFRRLLERAADLVGFDVVWRKPESEDPDRLTVRAIGSSPSDETIRFVRIEAPAGGRVKAGDLLAAVEADKASFEIAAPAPGTLEKWFVAEGDTVRVGTPVAVLHLEAAAPAVRRPLADSNDLPELKRRSGADPSGLPTSSMPRLPVAVIASGGDLSVVMGAVRSVMASREVLNEEFLASIPDWTAQDVRQRTGIERRYWLGEQESALSLAVRAARETLESEGLQISDVDALVCSTGTPGCMTPSMACRILRELSPEQGDVMVQAHDVNAACSGYLYALQTAWDLIHSRPEARVLVVTTETLSPLLDLADPGTAFLFGDAATATIVSRHPARNGACARVHRPVLSAKGEPDHVLFVPAMKSGEHIQMEGQQVFRVAIRRMIQMLEFACAESGIAVEDLSMIVPHQANTRIIDAIRQKIRAPEERMFNNIRLYGNTSSNTIPFALQSVLPARKAGDRIGLCAFGGGFTFGAAILERI